MIEPEFELDIPCLGCSALTVSQVSGLLKHEDAPPHTTIYVYYVPFEIYIIQCRLILYNIFKIICSELVGDFNILY